jgi:hypothetical protein
METALALLSRLNTAATFEISEKREIYQNHL